MSCVEAVSVVEAGNDPKVGNNARNVAPKWGPEICIESSISSKILILCKVGRNLKIKNIWRFARPSASLP